jgi:hypothetical protein
MVSLAIAILSLLVAGLGTLLNHLAIKAEARDRKQEAADRREELDLLKQQVQGVIDRENRELSGAVTIVCAELVRAAELVDAYHSRDLASCWALWRSSTEKPSAGLIKVASNCRPLKLGQRAGIELSLRGLTA